MSVQRISNTLFYAAGIAVWAASAVAMWIVADGPANRRDMAILLVATIGSVTILSIAALLIRPITGNWIRRFRNRHLILTIVAGLVAVVAFVVLIVSMRRISGEFPGPVFAMPFYVLTLPLLYVLFLAERMSIRSIFYLPIVFGLATNVSGWLGVYAGVRLGSNGLDGLIPELSLGVGGHLEDYLLGGGFVCGSLFAALLLFGLAPLGQAYRSWLVTLTTAIFLGVGGALAAAALPITVGFDPIENITFVLLAIYATCFLVMGYILIWLAHRQAQLEQKKL